MNHYQLPFLKLNKYMVKISEIKGVLFQNYGMYHIINVVYCTSNVFGVILIPFFRIFYAVVQTPSFGVVLCCQAVKLSQSHLVI